MAWSRTTKLVCCLALVALCQVLAYPLDPQEAIGAQGCAPELTSLRYPSAAIAGRITGPVSVTFTVDSNGRVSQLESHSHPLLLAGVEEALNAVRLGPECNGKKMTMQVNFRFADSDVTSFTKGISALQYEVIAPTPVVRVSISEPGIVRIEELYRQADLVAILQVLSGDAEHSDTAVYKAVVRAALKGTANGTTLYFIPFVGYRVGTEYVAFLHWSAKEVKPNDLPGPSYGLLSSPYTTMYQGYSVMPIEYVCVFGGEPVSDPCDYGVEIDTDQVILPKRIKTFPLESDAGTKDRKKWIRRTDFLRLLDLVKGSP